MSQNPIGTITDEERLVALRRREGAFVVDIADPVRTAGFPKEGAFAWRLREESDVPRLALAPIADPEEAGALPVRTPSTTGRELTIEVPESLLADGLDLDTEAYDDDNPLLFKPDEIDDGIAVEITPDGEPSGTIREAIEFTPIRFADGTPYRDEPISELSTDSDPVAEAELARDRGQNVAPRSEAISAPVDGAIVDDVLETTEASRAEVVQFLETIARHELVDETDDDTAASPVAVDDRIVTALDEESWEESVASELGADEAALEATREIHARQAAELLDAAGADADDYESRVPVVI